MNPEFGGSSGPEVEVTLEVGWPRCTATAFTTLADGMLIAQVGLGSSKHLGTVGASKVAKDQALARLKLAIQIYESSKAQKQPPIVLPGEA